VQIGWLWQEGEAQLAQKGIVFVASFANGLVEGHELVVDCGQVDLFLGH
jgi:hypothetical protein